MPTSRPVPNTQYVTGKNISARLTRNNKNLMHDLYDVIEWSAECEIEQIGQVEVMARQEKTFTVKNKRVLLPCDVYRILTVREGTCPLPYEFDGVYVNFNKDKFNATVQWYGVRTDENGYPVIAKGHEDACYWYCLQKLLFEDYLHKRIDQGRWDYIDNEMGTAIDAARSSFQHWTVDDANDLLRIILRMKRFIQQPKTL